MSLVLPLTERQQALLAAEAARAGMSVVDYSVMRLLGGPRRMVETEAERLAAIDECIGAFKEMPTSSDDYAREKQYEIDREERRLGLVPPSDVR